ncbi:MAG: alpha/beta fold hydrolase [Desulfosarcinaceae bacterium]|nr:alpha/beta fold hydrolase [Desulfosarcinaceae bacterium]
MQRRGRRWGAVLLTTLLLLVMPALLKEKGPPPLHGPELTSLRYTEVFFENGHAGIRLAGMLFLPDGGGPFPTAVIIHGSGTSRRNSVWYLSLAQFLQNHGVAVLLPDKRGSEKSEGQWLGANFEDLATDTISAVAYVKHQDRFAPAAIGLIGMSQGGWIAPIAASQSSDIAFVVSMSGAAVTTTAQLLHEEVHNIAPYTYHFIAKLIAPLTARNLMKKPFFTPVAGFDPIPYWKKINLPVFFAFGENDPNVPVDDSLARLQTHQLHHFVTKTYPNGGHAIRDRQTNALSEAFLMDLVRFIGQVR